jgi:hypothetical protein
MAVTWGQIPKRPMSQCNICITDHPLPQTFIESRITIRERRLMKSFAVCLETTLSAGLLCRANRRHSRRLHVMVTCVETSFEMNMRSNGTRVLIAQARAGIYVMRSGVTDHTSSVFVQNPPPYTHTHKSRVLRSWKTPLMLNSRILNLVTTERIAVGFSAPGLPPSHSYVCVKMVNDAAVT